MIDFLTLHLGTIIVGLLVLAIVSGIFAKLIRDKRKGKCIGCDGGCGGCPANQTPDVHHKRNGRL